MILGLLIIVAIIVLAGSKYAGRATGAPPQRDVLGEAVARGIITAEQRDQLRALGVRDVAGEGVAAGSAHTAREVNIGMNGVGIAYGIGALVVLFAFGWFLVDRWRVLGPSGVFGVACAYGAIFLTVAHLTKREGFPVAQGVATLLAVAMVPLAIWALLQWTGVWSPELVRVCSLRVHPFFMCQGEPLAIELSAVAASLIALRRVPFPPLTIPIAVVCVTMSERFIRELSPGNYNGSAMGWRFVVVASLIGAGAYVVDRLRRDDDYAVWLWLAAVLCAMFGAANIFSADKSLRPFLGPVALVVLVASVYLRRRSILALGVIGTFGYLAWLATDVFKLTLAFPLLLAVLGVAIIIATVWLQRNFPEFVRRVGGDASQPPTFPGGVVMLLTPALLGLLMTQDALQVDREREADQRSRNHAYVARQRRDSTLRKPKPAPVVRP